MLRLLLCGKVAPVFWVSASRCDKKPQSPGKEAHFAAHSTVLQEDSGFT